MGDFGELQVGWHADPFGRFEHRWWDGTGWTERVRSGRNNAIDPPVLETAPAGSSTEGPVAPIEDALLPIRRPRIADKLAVAFGCLVFLGLVAVFVVAIAG